MVEYDKNSLPADGVYDDFSNGKLNTDIWSTAGHNWGGTTVNAEGETEDYNGGVIPANISFGENKIVFTARGDRYEGPVRGVTSKGTARKTGKRTGACIYTKEDFASGCYEVRAKLCPELGACSAFWTYEYHREENGHEVNQEIDIEFPGRPGPELSGFSFDKVLYTTWEGLLNGEYYTEFADTDKHYADGRFHTFRFDWHTGDAEKGEEKRVEYYFDGKLVYKTTKNIPVIAGKYWVGVWFPNQWAGVPDFDVSTLEVEYVKIVPFHESGDIFRKAEKE